MADQKADFYKKKPKNDKINYVKGVNKYTMKKIAIYEFGEAGFISISKDDKIWNFVIVVSQDVEQWQIEKFKAYWEVSVKRLTD